MKVLFITRPTVFSGPGGDTVQLLKTKEYLEGLGKGIEVTIATEVTPQLDGYDLVHFFNLRNPQDLIHNVLRVKNRGIPSVLSTIWGSYAECDKKCRTGLQKWFANNISEYKLEYMKAVVRAFINRNVHRGMLRYFLRGHLSTQKQIIDNVTYLLPNSITELERVRADMCRPQKPGDWVANAVDSKVFDFDKIIVEPRFERFRGCIMTAARVEIRKSQLDFIKAANDLPYQVLIVGKPSPNSMKYYEECKLNAGPNIEFIDHVTHNELAQLYKIAKAHALISWMETPGLSSLEAGALNCNLLITDRGDTEFYFENKAVYVEPGDIESIKLGIIKVMETEVEPSIKDRILKNFTWDNTAIQTYKSYQEAIKLNG